MPDLKNFARTCRDGIYCSPNRFVTYLVNGLIIIVPLAVTIWILIWLFNTIDGLLAPILDWAFGRHIPGVSFAVIIVLVLLIGYFGIKIGNRRAFSFMEARFTRVPVFGPIYGGTRQILDSFTKKDAKSFLEVVFLEFPRKGIYSPGFVTGMSKCKDGTAMYNVFIPTAPTPAGGYLQVVPESQIIHSSMSVGDAMKLIISIGRVSPEDLGNMINAGSQSDALCKLKEETNQTPENPL